MNDECKIRRAVAVIDEILAEARRCGPVPPDAAQGIAELNAVVEALKWVLGDREVFDSGLDLMEIAASQARLQRWSRAERN